MNAILKKVALIMIGILFVGLVVYACLGVFNRFWADDWCYNADFKELGFVGTLKGYNYITTYASSRYSLTFFSGLLYYLGIMGVQIMTPLNLIFWVIGLTWSLYSICKITSFSMTKAGLLGIVAVSIYFSLYTTPHLYQSVYWRSGTLPYGEPIVFGLLVFGLILHQATLNKKSIWFALLAVLIAFFAGGFSEAGCAVLITAASIFLLVTIIYRRQMWAKNSIPIALAVFLALNLAMLVMINSPTTSYRLGLYRAQATLSEFPLLTAKFAYDFIKFSFLDSPIPFLAFIGVSTLFGYVFVHSEEQERSFTQLLIQALIIIVVALVLIAASYAPSAFIEKSPPAPRTRIIPRFVLTFALVIVSWFSGQLIRKKIKTRLMTVLVIGLMLIAAVYLVYTLMNVFDLIPLYAQRAQLWDERDASILRAIKQGQKQVSVSGIDGLPIGGIGDFVPKGFKVYWVNICAARYYGLEAIQVTSP